MKDSCFRSSRPEVFCKKGVLRNLPKFTGKHLCRSLFFNKVVAEACNFIKKETLAQVFSCEFCEISKNTFFTEHLWGTASDFQFNQFLCRINVVSIYLRETTHLMLILAKFKIKNNQVAHHDGWGDSF